MNASMLKPTEVEVSQDQASSFAVVEPGSAWTVEALQNRAEVVTPLVVEILQSWPQTRWGINE
jgi:hypothetical protein